jgi:ABC-type transport system substrate-binding protein
MGAAGKEHDVVARNREQAQEREQEQDQNREDDPRERDRRELVERIVAGRIDRRRALARAAALGLAPAALAHALTGRTAAQATPAPTGDAAAIPGPPWEGGQRGGVGRVAWMEDTVTFDPPLAYDQVGYYGIANFYRGLLYFGLNSEPQLDLAESMDISDDGLRYTFRIKPGVTFHNGRALSAQDFKFTWERASSPTLGSWVQGFLGSVEGHADFVAGTAEEITGIRVVDDLTIELALSQPDVTIPGVLAIPPFFVLPAAEVQAEGEAFQFTMGTGPWKLDELDQTRRRYRCSRFEEYVYADRLPYLDALEWEWGVSDELQAQRVQRGELEAAGSNVPPATVLQLRQANTPEDQLQLWSTLLLNWYEFDVTRPPFDDKRVRQAVNLAFNRARLQRLLIDPTGHFYPPALLGYDANATVYPYDPERAKALLAEAGVGPIEITVPIFGDSQGDSQQLLQQDLAAVGITVSLTQDPATENDYGADLRGMYPVWPRGWGMGLPDPAELFNAMLKTGAPSNYGGYGNAEIDRLGAEAQRETDPAARAALYAEMEQILLDDAPYIFVGVAQWASLKRPELQNFTWEPVLYQHWDRYWLGG